MVMAFCLCLASIAALLAFAWLVSSSGYKPRQEPNDEIEGIAEIFSRLDANQQEDILKYIEYLRDRRK